ncbi:MAG: hypothetical protein V7L04_23275 [Nostoc sp.]|uniref:hypothetical protein n=1 Tax=Nostoc sp. TaxID=1180 RepID=UPI002FFD4843
MQSRQYTLAFLATTLLLTLTNQSSRAINIQGQPGLRSNNLFSYSFIPNEGIGVTSLGSYEISSLSSYFHLGGEAYEIERGGTPGLRSNLRPFLNRGWSFSRGRDLTNSTFEISRYYACGIDTACGVGLYDYARSGGVGSTFSMDSDARR